jgi:Fe-S cluster assembly ATPase SufC
MPGKLEMLNEEIAHLKRQQHRIMGPNGSGMSAAELRDRILDLIRNYLTQPKVQTDATAVLTLNALAGDIQVINLEDKP